MPSDIWRGLAAALPVFAIAVCSTPAQSGNTTTVGPLTLTANYNTVQFKFAYTGDDNQNATVLVRYWRTSSSANKDTAVVPTRDVKYLRFTGVVFWLDDNTGLHRRGEDHRPGWARGSTRN
jgi:hypothetical protein